MCYNIFGEESEALYMQQTITAKLQILVNPSDEQLFRSTMKAYCDACNYISEYIYKTHNLSRYSVQENTYYQVREVYGLRSQMAVSCVRTVIAKYKTILENQIKWIKPVFRFPQLDLVWNRDYSLNAKNNVFSVNTLNGRIKVTFFKNGFEQYFSDNCKFGTAKLVNKHGKFFLHIPVTYEIDGLDISDVSNVVGIDRGIRFITTTYDSNGKTNFYNGNIIKQKRGHYKVLRKQLQQVRTSSSRKRLKAIGQRENRWMQDINHCISKALVESNPRGTLFVLEDLTGIRSATEKVKVKDRYVSVSWSYYDLEQKLIYKALRNHQIVKKVNPAYTSQTCPKCGHTEKSNRDKHNHIFCCKTCGYKSNDDRIGAMNLYRMGINLLVPDTVAME
jgi:IS605 OrfB family transposase